MPTSVASHRRAASAVLAVLLFGGAEAQALDKQGSAHGGQLVNTAREFNVSGAFLLGFSPYNPSYAARPDNSGLAFLRYGAHLDIDLLGSLLSIPVDVNFFSDRLRPGLLVVAPTEFDVITGLTSTFPAGPGALELGVRFEHDRPLDEGTFTQTNLDARARYLFSLAHVAPAVGAALGEGDVSGWATLGWFIVNPSYAARPDNSGLALLRYALHAELSVLKDVISVGVDGTFFTDRQAHPLRPSELDLTAELIFHAGHVEVHLAWERDMPLDRPGLVQEFLYVLATVSFDLRADFPRTFSHRNLVVSP